MDEKLELVKLDENTYAKKGWLGWRFIFPIKKELDKPFEKGNINWKNMIIPNKSQFIWMCVFLGILIFSVWAYNHDIAMAKDCLNHPCKYCYGWEINITNSTQGDYNFTLPGFEPVLKMKSKEVKWNLLSLG